MIREQHKVGGEKKTNFFNTCIYILYVQAIRKQL